MGGEPRALASGAGLVHHTVRGLGGEHGDWLVALLSKRLHAGRKRWHPAVRCGPHPAIPTEAKSHRPPKPGDAGPVFLPAGCWWIDCFLIQSNNQEMLIAW